MYQNFEIYYSNVPSFFFRLTPSSLFTSLPSSFFFSPLFSFSVTFSLRFCLLYLFFFFPYHSPSLSFFFLRLGRCHWDQPSWVRLCRGVQPHQWGRCRGDILFWSPSVFFLFIYLFIYLLWLWAVIGYSGGGLCCVWCDFVEDFEFFFFFLFCCFFCLEWKNRTWYFNV